MEFLELGTESKAKELFIKAVRILVNCLGIWTGKWDIGEK